MLSEPQGLVRPEGLGHGVQFFFFFLVAEFAVCYSVCDTEQLPSETERFALNGSRVDRFCRQ
jgi:hypothetical protein